MEEETGYQAKFLEPLGKFYASPARSNTVFYAYTARGLIKGDCDFDETEVIQPVWISPKKLEMMIAKGQVMDPYLLDIYLLYKIKFKVAS